jgi:hypothetical protein
MARVLSLLEKLRNSFLVLVGLLISVQPSIASNKKPGPTVPERLAAVRSRMRELQPNPYDAKRSDKGDVSTVAQWGNQWANWNNWNNWSNWTNWNNWGNFGNWGNG